MTEDNVLDQKADFEILYGKDENETMITAWAYQMDQIADHFTSYFE